MQKAEGFARKSQTGRGNSKITSLFQLWKNTSSSIPNLSKWRFIAKRTGDGCTIFIRHMISFCVEAPEKDSFSLQRKGLSWLGVLYENHAPHA
jgi:hypothetical protein